MEAISKQAKNYLIAAIVLTIFCCPLFGVIAVVYAGKAQTYIAQDNPAKAMMAVEKAKFWNIAAIAFAIFAYIAFAGYMALGC